MFLHLLFLCLDIPQVLPLPHIFPTLSLNTIVIFFSPLFFSHTECSIPVSHKKMAALVLAVLILAMSGHSSATWCICKDGLSDAVLQKTLDYACGAGADCNPTHQNGPCYTPNTVRAHCNYAVNGYFQRKGQGSGSCDFAGTATLTATDPSTTGCSYPSSVSAAGSTTLTPTPITTTPSTSTTPSTMTPTTTTPTTTTPYGGTSTGVLGGVGTGLGPSGSSTDYSDGGFRLQLSISLFSFFTTLFMFMRV